ncbi:MAG: FAD-binding oxidoreductase [Micropruina sp.]
MTSGVEQSWWWSDLEPAERDLWRAPLPGDTDVDVAIVGAGFTGLWTAYYLARLDPSLRIIILERDKAGSGASGRNGGWASALLPTSWGAIARTYGREATLAWQRALDRTLPEIRQVASREGIDAHIADGGYLKVATNPAQVVGLQHSLEEARAWGRGEDDLRWLSAAQAKDLVNSPAILAGLHTPHCLALQPARLVRGLALAVERCGVTIHEDTLVTEITPGQLRTTRGTVRASVVVSALEGYAATLAGHHRDRLPVYSTLTATEPLPEHVWQEIGWESRCTLNDGRRQLFYAQRTATCRIAFGGRGAPYRYGSKIEDPVARLDHWAAHLRRLLVRLFPQLSDVTITHRWGGVLGVPRDWMPSVGFDRRTGLARAGGYSGDGVALTNLAGRTLAHLITDTPSDLTGMPWVNHRSPTWEPEPLRWIGATLGQELAVAADRGEVRTGRPSKVLGAAFGALTGHG